MKRIFCLIDSLGSGGAQRQIVGLASFLKKKGYVVKVVTYYDIPFYKFYLDDNLVENETLVCGRSFCVRLTKVLRALRQFQPDVVISFMDTPNILSSVAKILRNRFKLIVSERNTTQVLTTREKIKFFLYRHADYIVPNSFSQEEFIIKHYPRLSSKCKVITNFVDTERFTPKSYGAKSIVLRIVGIGRIAHQKNIPVLINAIKIVNDSGFRVQVDWYGKRYEAYEECNKLIRQCDLEEVFLFHEPYDPIVEKYQDADLFVLPSIYEGFPNVLCEALSCGIPSIASDVCDNGRIIIGGSNGYLFQSGDSKALANCIMQFISLSDEEKRDMSNKCRELAVIQFSQESFINNYLELIEY